MDTPKYQLCCLVPCSRVADINTNGIVAKNGCIEVFEDCYTSSMVYVGRMLAELYGRGRYRVYLVDDAFAGGQHLERITHARWMMMAERIPVEYLRLGEQITIKAETNRKKS